MIQLDANLPSKETSISLPLNDSINSVVFVTSGQCIICLLILLTVFGDATVYAAFFLNRHLRTRTNALFLSLATSDILLALLVMPLEVVRLLHYPYWPLGETACHFWNSASVALGSASVCNLCAISVDRFLAISRPLRYRSDISTAVVASLVLLWSFAFFSGLGSYFIWTQPNPLECTELSAPLTKSILLMVFNLLVPFLICLLTNAKIFQISRQQARRIAATRPWAERGNNFLFLERKSAKTLGILVGVFAITFLPFLVFHALDGAFEEKLPNRFYFGSVAKWLIFVSSAINWALYGYLNEEYREALYKISNVFGCRACRGETDQINSIQVYTVS
ncbi:histamine H2 receptor-like [Oculina patagonica]